MNDTMDRIKAKSAGIGKLQKDIDVNKKKALEAHKVEEVCHLFIFIFSYIFSVVKHFSILIS